MDTRVQVLVIRVLVFQNILMALFLWSNRQVSIEEGDGKAREFGVMFIETSAKAGFNIKVRESFIHCCFHKRIKVSSNFGCINGEWSPIFVCANHIVSHIPILTKMLHSFSLSPLFCSFLCSFTYWDPNSVRQLQPLFRKIAAALPGMEALSSTKQEDMVDVNLKPTVNTSSTEQQGGGCAC